MFTKQNVSLVAAALASMVMCGTAAAVDSVLTVSATLTSACAVSPAATISFGAFSTLAAVDQTAHSGTTFTVACSSDMVPTIYATGARTIIKDASSIAFNLSLTTGAAANDLPATLETALALPLVKDGTAKEVQLHARLVKADFAAKPAGAYTSGPVTVSVLY